MHKKCSAVIHAHLFIRDHCVALKGFGHVRSLHNEPRYSRSDFQYLKTTQLVKRNDIASLQTCMFRNFCMMLRASANFSDVCKNVLMWKTGVCLRNKNFITWRFCCVRIFSWLFNRLLQHKLENSASGLPQGAHLVFSQSGSKSCSFLTPSNCRMGVNDWETSPEEQHRNKSTRQGRVKTNLHDDSPWNRKLGGNLAATKLPLQNLYYPGNWRASNSSCHFRLTIRK